MEILRTEHLCKVYGTGEARVVALKDVSFTLRKGEFAEGLESAVLAVGEKLKSYFPYSKDDVNEQPDDISFGGNNK